MKALGLDESLAVQTEATLSAMLGRSLEDSLLGSGWCGKYAELSVGEDAVDIEEEELDFAGPSVSGALWHWRNSSTRRFGKPAAEDVKEPPAGADSIMQELYSVHAC